MNKVLLGLFASTVVALPALAALEVGQNAPQFQAQASLNGKAFDYKLADELKKGPVVVYFYPSAFTQGCNVQAHEFAVNMEKFNAAGATVVGVSLDSIARLNDFSADPAYCAGKLAVASDATGDIARSYGLTVSAARAGMNDTRGQAIDHGFASRHTFVVTSDGKVNKVIGGQGVSPADNVKQSLEAVTALQHAAH